MLGGELSLHKITTTGNTGLSIGIGIIYNNSSGTYNRYGGVFTFVRGKENVTFIDKTNYTTDTLLTKSQWGSLFFNTEGYTLIVLGA